MSLDAHQRLNTAHPYIANTTPNRLQDNATWVHINEWTAPSGVRATNLGLIVAGAGDEQLAQPLAGGGGPAKAPLLLSVSAPSVSVCAA